MNIIHISYLLQLILIILAIIIILGTDKIRIVIILSLFSLVTASLYFFNNAPDVALAEVAIGSAIMPLIFIISISKQNEFIVMSHVDDDFLNNDEISVGKGYMILEEFTKYYGLKLNIYTNKHEDLKGIFRKNNVDLIVKISIDSNKYIFEGKETNALMNKLSQMMQSEDNIDVIMVKEGETDE